MLVFSPLLVVLLLIINDQVITNTVYSIYVFAFLYLFYKMMYDKMREKVAELVAACKEEYVFDEMDDYSDILKGENAESLKRKTHKIFIVLKTLTITPYIVHLFFATDLVSLIVYITILVIFFTASFFTIYPVLSEIRVLFIIDEILSDAMDEDDAE